MEQNNPVTAGFIEVRKHNYFINLEYVNTAVCLPLQCGP